tara:strand:- start:463 stop:831 length:369 start_codon:yes stop_codon:yes gene_type:complete
MEREIKFRGWFQQDFRGAEFWVYGLYYIDDVGNSIITHGGTHCTVLDDTVSQYTGLHDKFGKEIYEGDVIKARIKNKDEWHEGVVKFNRSSWVIFHETEDGRFRQRRTSNYREYIKLKDEQE